MKGFLLDVNVLVAWGWADHTHHLRVATWIASAKMDEQTEILTSAIPELGFVRVSVQRTGGRLPVSTAAATLARMLESLGDRHRFPSDDRSSAHPWPGWCHSAARTSDAHLLALASDANFVLATLDEGIPGAFLIPLF